MESQENHKLLYYGLLRKIKPYLEGDILDYGCGTGLISNALRSLAKENSKISAYDGLETGEHFSSEKFEETKKNLKSEIKLYESKQELPKAFFDTVLLLCMLHGNHYIIEQCSPYIKTRGYLIVLDHDKSHLSNEEFLAWLTDADRKEINERSLDAVMYDHRKMKLEDCCRIGKENGYETIKFWNHKTLSQRYPFYLWIGQKIYD
ncbi:MAG: hypothetical protein ACOYT4_00100 [Nanoarchaeota archaeon]